MGTSWSDGGVAGFLGGGGVLHHLELAGVVVAGVNGEVRASARARGNLGACELARVWGGGGREEGAGEGPLEQRGVRRSQDRRGHGLARVGGRAGLVQLAGVQLVQLQLGAHEGEGHHGGLAGGFHRQVAQLGWCQVFQTPG